MLTYLFIVLLCLELFCSKKPDSSSNIPKPPTPNEQLPPSTTTSAGTFVCKVNGNAWVAKSNKTGWPPTYASVNRAIGYQKQVSGSIINGNNTFKIISMLYKNVGKTEYIIGYNNSEIPVGQYVDANLQWRTDSLLGGVVLLRYDTLKQIISGTFYFDCINKETGEILKITEGRFDGNFLY
ncbi:MAG: DUF6252 family protein [Bacteroidia bacterium]|jgi:hypothetical protein|nr:DUF6252 family protein [Bacteroidia bacterium]